MPSSMVIEAIHMVSVGIRFLVICVSLGMRTFTVSMGALAVTSDLTQIVGMGVSELLAMETLQDSLQDVCF